MSMRMSVCASAAAIAAGLSVSAANADNWEMYITVDNYFDLYFGTGVSTTGAAIGSGNSWPTEYFFTAVSSPLTSFVYIVTSSDQAVARGLIADFRNLTTNQNALSGDSNWAVFPAGAYAATNPFSPGAWPPNTLATQAQVDFAINYATNNGLWVTPTGAAGYDNDPSTPTAPVRLSLGILPQHRPERAVGVVRLWERDTEPVDSRAARRRREPRRVPDLPHPGGCARSGRRRSARDGRGGRGASQDALSQREADCNVRRGRREMRRPCWFHAAMSERSGSAYKPQNVGHLAAVAVHSGVERDAQGRRNRSRGVHIGPPSQQPVRQTAQRERVRPSHQVVELPCVRLGVDRSIRQTRSCNCVPSGCSEPGRKSSHFAMPNARTSWP